MPALARSRGLLALIGALILVALASAGSAAAADPQRTPPPSRAPSCADRYPADGPAGVDLQLGCVVNEVVHGYLGLGSEGSGEPARISAWLPSLGGVALGLAGIVLVIREARRRTGRRLASVVATSWWSCPACRSLNAAGTGTCYRCGRTSEAGLTELRTDAEPLMPQSFGRPEGVEPAREPPALRRVPPAEPPPADSA